MFGSSTLNWRWLFQGREYESLLGAYDFRARTLWPDLGRFGQEDPSSATAHPNLYQSLLGNWTTNSDPSGRVVVLMHGIRDTGKVWAQEVADSLVAEWMNRYADPGQDVINLVNQRDLRVQIPGCPHNTYCFGNAFLAANGRLDEDTIGAGFRVATFFERLRAHLDASETRKGEPIQALAHSHGTAMLLAAARHNGISKHFKLGQVVLAGSDLQENTDLTALLGSAEMVHNYYSSSDMVVGVAALGAAGSGGFREDTREENLLTNPRLMQEEVEGIGHSASAEERRSGKLSWVSSYMARNYYAEVFSLRAARLRPEPKPWIDSYEKLRNEMGLQQWAIPLPRYYRQPYPLP